MGKAAILLMISALISGSMILYNSEQLNFATMEDQAERQEQIVAREIARTGFNTMVTRAQETEASLKSFNPNTPLTEIIREVNGGENSTFVQETEGGHFSAHLERTGLEAYRINATGFFGDASHQVSGTYLMGSIMEVPEEETDDTFYAGIVNEPADKCTAVFVQRFLPINDRGHGTQDDGVNPLNPSVDCELGEEGCTYEPKKYMRLPPEQLFEAADRYSRSSSRANIYTTLPPMTRLGVVIGVDEIGSDGTCPVINDPSEAAQQFHSLVAVRPGKGGNGGGSTGRGNKGGGQASNQQGAVDDVLESRHALLQQWPEGDGNVWRIAFEMGNWTDEQLEDVKVNGYPDCLGSTCTFGNGTYGGTGWATDSFSYAQLEARDGHPSFNDFVLEFWLRATDGEMPRPGDHAPGQQEPLEVVLAE